MTPDDSTPGQGASWRRTYFDLLCRAGDADHEQAEALKREHLPTRVFKYRCPTERAFQSVRSATVWLADAATFNDPIDSTFLIDLEHGLATAFVRAMGERAFALPDAAIEALVTGVSTTRGAMMNLVRQDPTLTEAQVANDADVLTASVVQAAREKAAKMREEWQQGTKVSCFSERVDSVLMWSHYADQHRGFCVEYDVARTAKKDLFPEALFPVLYLEQRLDVTPIVFAIDGSRKHEANFPPVPLLAAMVKASDWAYEREWRLVDFKPDRKGGIERRTPKPSGIYLGCRMEPQARLTLLSLADLAGIPAYQMKVSETSLGLVWERTKL